MWELPEGLCWCYGNYNCAAVGCVGATGRLVLVLLSPCSKNHNKCFLARGGALFWTVASQRRIHTKTPLCTTCCECEFRWLDPTSPCTGYCAATAIPAMRRRIPQRRLQIWPTKWLPGCRVGLPGGLPVAHPKIDDIHIEACWSILFSIVSRRRPYRVECTGSLPTSEVKRRRARLVLGWGTVWEHPRVLSAFDWHLFRQEMVHLPLCLFINKIVLLSHCYGTAR